MPLYRHRTFPAACGQAGATTVEFVGLAVAVAALLLAMHPALAGQAPRVGAAMHSALAGAIGGHGEPGRPAPVARRATFGARHWQGSRVADGGSVAMDADDLRLHPLIPTQAHMSRGWQATGSTHGVVADVHARVCDLCLSVGERHHAVLGTAGPSTGGPHSHGVLATLRIEAMAALASMQVYAGAHTTIHGVTGRVQTQGHVTLGASGSVLAKGELSSREQSLALGADGVLGAEARVEGRASLGALGASLQQTAGAEGWVGVGGRAEGRFGRTSTGFSYHIALGGALGLGGEVDASGAVDTSHMSLRNRERLLGVLSVAAPFSPVHLLSLGGLP